MKLPLVAAALFAASSAAFADFVIIDQIGEDNDDFYLGTRTYPSTDYDPNTPFDYMAIDNFTLTERTTITQVDVLYALGGAFGNPVEDWRVSIFTSTDAAVASLEGDAFFQVLDAPSATISGVGVYGSSTIDLVSFELTGATLEPGEYWVTVMSVSYEFAHGQMITFGTTLGDQEAYRVNYNQSTPLTRVLAFPDVNGDLPYRVWGTEPTEEPCAADFDGSGTADVNDLLGFLGAFRTQGPGSDFDGSGSVDVNDLLGFLGAFRAGC
jgi:hypothetical protein